MAPMSSDDGNEPPALGAGTRSFAASFWEGDQCWGALRRHADVPTPLALFVAQGVHTGAHDQADSPDYNCKITTRWYLTAAFIGGARRSRTADLLNAILKTSNFLSILAFPVLAVSRLKLAFMRVLSFRDVPRGSLLVFPRCFPNCFGSPAEIKPWPICGSPSASLTD